MSMIYQEIDKLASKLESFYKEAFEKRFGVKPPNTETEDMNTLRWLLSQYSDEVQARSLITQYLCLDDDWIRGQGYPLRLLKKSVQAVIVSQATVNTLQKELWVVGISESGTPVVSSNQHVFRGKGVHFNPVLLSEWHQNAALYPVVFAPETPKPY